MPSTTTNAAECSPAASAAAAAGVGAAPAALVPVPIARVRASAPLPPTEGDSEGTIDEPGPHDVICGRGGGTNNHPGNVQWRNLVAMSKAMYLSLAKRQKMQLAQNIVDAIRSQQDPPGRFLQKDERTLKWREIGDARARDKTSQALREDAPILRKEMEDARKAWADRMKVMEEARGRAAAQSQAQAHARAAQAHVHAHTQAAHAQVAQMQRAAIPQVAAAHAKAEATRLQWQQLQQRANAARAQAQAVAIAQSATAGQSAAAAQVLCQAQAQVQAKAQHRVPTASQAHVQQQHAAAAAQAQAQAQVQANDQQQLDAAQAQNHHRQQKLAAAAAHAQMEAKAQAINRANLQQQEAAAATRLAQAQHKQQHIAVAQAQAEKEAQALKASAAKAQAQAQQLATGQAPAPTPTQAGNPGGCFVANAPTALAAPSPSPMEVELQARARAQWQHRQLTDAAKQQERSQEQARKVEQARAQKSPHAACGSTTVQARHQRMRQNAEAARKEAAKAMLMSSSHDELLDAAEARARAQHAEAEAELNQALLDVKTAGHSREASASVGARMAKARSQMDAAKAQLRMVGARRQMEEAHFRAREAAEAHAAAQAQAAAAQQEVLNSAAGRNEIRKDGKKEAKGNADGSVKVKMANASSGTDNGGERMIVEEANGGEIAGKAVATGVAAATAAPLPEVKRQVEQTQAAQATRAVWPQQKQKLHGQHGQQDQMRLHPNAGDKEVSAGPSGPLPFPVISKLATSAGSDSIVASNTVAEAASAPPTTALQRDASLTGSVMGVPPDATALRRGGSFSGTLGNGGGRKAGLDSNMNRMTSPSQIALVRASSLTGVAAGPPPALGRASSLNRSFGIGCASPAGMMAACSSPGATAGAAAFRQRSMVAAQRILALSQARVAAESEALALAQAQVRALQEAALGREHLTTEQADDGLGARLRSAQEAVKARELAMARARAELLEAKAMEARMEAEALAAAAEAAEAASAENREGGAGMPPPTALGRSVSQPLGRGGVVNPLYVEQLHASLASGVGGMAFGHDREEFLSRMQEEARLRQELMAVRQQRASVATARALAMRRGSAESTGSSVSACPPLTALGRASSFSTSASLANSTGAETVGVRIGEKVTKSRGETLTAAATPTAVLSQSSAMPDSGSAAAQEKQESSLDSAAPRSAEGETSLPGATTLPPTKLWRGSSLPVTGSALESAVRKENTARDNPDEIDEDEAETQADAASALAVPPTNLGRAVSQPGGRLTSRAPGSAEHAVLKRLEAAKEAASRAVREAAAAAEAAKKAAEKATNEFEAAFHNMSSPAVRSSRAKGAAPNANEAAKGSSGVAGLPMTTVRRSATEPGRYEASSEAKNHREHNGRSLVMRQFRQDAGDPAASIEQRVNELWAARNAEAQAQAQAQTKKDRAPPMTPFARVVTSDNEGADNDECHDDLIDDDDEDEPVAASRVGMVPPAPNCGSTLMNVAQMPPPPLPTMRRYNQKASGVATERKRQVSSPSASPHDTEHLSAPGNAQDPSGPESLGKGQDAPLRRPPKKRKGMSGRDKKEKDSEKAPPPPSRTVRASSTSALDLLMQAAVTRIGNE